LIGGTEATGHEAEAKFQKKTQHQVRPTFARPGARQGRGVDVKESAKSIGVAKLALHDLRRTCARLCHASGGELEQIQFLLGHVSVQTTKRYPGCKQRIRSAVNDRIGIEPNP
jgi:integrase